MAQHLPRGRGRAGAQRSHAEQVEEFIAGYTGLPQQPLVLH